MTHTHTAEHNQGSQAHQLEQSDVVLSSAAAAVVPSVWPFWSSALTAGRANTQQR